LLAKISIDGVADINNWHDPNAENLVKQVSISVFTPKGVLYQANHVQPSKD
jgi:hypothetical protein